LEVMGEVDDERAMYVALALTPGIGPHRLATLLKACRSALGAHAAPFAFLASLPGFSRAGATSVKEARPSEGHDLLRIAAEMSVECVVPSDADYPSCFRHLTDPPTLVFLAGDRSLLERPAVAIVGSRDHTAYGAEACRAFATAAASSGVVVVSGMARGLDAIAHLGALDVGGPTIGVLGNGHGVVYPAANRDLYHRVRAEGLLLSEFPPGERPSIHTFPRRNRLISALARVTIVVEAAPGSGALITAEAALDQGKEVMAVPGNITSHTSAGTNRMIRDGAAPLLEVSDLLAHYQDLAGAGAAVGRTDSADAKARALPLGPELDPSLSPEERRLLTALASGPLPIDELISRAQMGVAEALATLFALELSGRVEQSAGPVFRCV
jgi:DNA processing protein